MSQSGSNITFATQPIIRAGILGAMSREYELSGDFMRSDLPDGTVLLTPRGGADDASFTLPAVKIGIGFHWERVEPQTFRGTLRIEPDGLMINEVSLEEYLTSVIASEMNANAPRQLLMAHAIVARSWLLAMLIRQRKQLAGTLTSAGIHTRVTHNPVYHCREIIKWYDREAHTRFDVCTDDHCQRYQGITRAAPPQVREAVAATRGMVLTYNGEVCDARFSKCCGGRTEQFDAAWEDIDLPYLRSVSDTDADDRCYCADATPELLSSSLNSYDLEDPGFNTWHVTVNADELSRIVAGKTGIDIGRILALIPVSRGESGRITKLLIRGVNESVIVGKELEIRRVLSPTHLKSSAFTITATDINGNIISDNDNRVPEIFTFEGRGWGHGVGLCQIGAAVMAVRGTDYKSILKHYYTDAKITTLYT
ncbi:MAG: SpoIID/LytB domain-containing protein [Muribaculaceae bacterium]|nr:SpoIID/LytB domain-containing protein [Muribaculaceae bacterium]